MSHARMKLVGGLGAVLLIVIAGGAVEAMRLHGNAALPGSGDPSYAACVRAHQKVCNPAARSYLQTINPSARPPSNNAKYISREQAIQIAREFDQPAAPALSTTFARMMSRSDYEKLGPYTTRNGAADPRRPVWVVTVHADITTEGSLVAPGVVKPVYTVVIDAETGMITDACKGCADLG